MKLSKLKKTIIIGLGNISIGYDRSINSSKFVKTHAKAIAHSKNFILYAGIDPNSSKRSDFEKAYKVSAYITINEIPPADIALVIIACPTDHHFKALEDVLKKFNPKVILCEKALSNKVEEAKAMVKLCEQKKIQLFVNYVRRSDPGTIEVKKMFDSKIIKTPVKGVCWYTKGYFHNGSHFFNLLEFWLGGYKNSKVISKGRIYNNEPEPDVSINFKYGNIIFLALKEEDYSFGAIHFLSKSGQLKYEGGGNEILWNPSQKNILNNNALKINNDLQRYQLNVMKEIQKFFDGKPCNLCTGKQALITIKSMNLSIL